MFDYTDIHGLHVPSLKLCRSTDVKVGLMKLFGIQWKSNFKKIKSVLQTIKCRLRYLQVRPAFFSNFCVSVTESTDSEIFAISL